MKIYCNKRLLIAGVGLCLLFVALSVLVPYYLIDDSDPQKLTAQIIFAIWGFLYVCGSAMCLPRWYAYIRITDGNVVFKKAFSKAITQPLSKYRYFYEGYYIHGSIIGVGVKVKYVILSQNKISGQMLSQINKMESSISMVKIRYSRKNLVALYSQLPLSQQNKFDKVFNVNVIPDMKDK